MYYLEQYRPDGCLSYRWRVVTSRSQQCSRDEYATYELAMAEAERRNAYLRRVERMRPRRRKTRTLLRDIAKRSAGQR